MLSKVSFSKICCLPELEEDKVLLLRPLAVSSFSLWGDLRVAGASVCTATSAVFRATSSAVCVELDLDSGGRVTADN